MWCNGSWLWMTVGTLAMVAFWGAFIWMILSLIRPQHDSIRPA
jgi:hypothetical protein